MITELPPDMAAGLMAYGHNRKDDCNDIELLEPIGADRSAIVQALQGINPKGMTPLNEAVRLAAAQLRDYEGSASIVVVGDGKETCQGDPCAAAREAAGTGVGLRIHVVGFDVTPEETAQLECIAEGGKGNYYVAASAEQLVSALAEVQKEVVQPNTAKSAPPPPKPANDGIFEEHFDGESLSDAWTILNPDENRFALLGGQALNLATKPTANMLMLRQPISGNFVATVKVSMELKSVYNYANFVYIVDNDNWVILGIGPANADSAWFTKKMGGQKQEIKKGDVAPADRGTWYLQIERSGRKFIGRVSLDRITWQDVGDHTILKMGDGHLRLDATSNSDVDIEVFFDDFVVRRAK